MPRNSRRENLLFFTVTPPGCSFVAMIATVDGEASAYYADSAYRHDRASDLGERLCPTYRAIGLAYLRNHP
jgi:hypothetical protein